MDAALIQLSLGVVGTVMIGIMTNALTPVALRGLRRVTRRVRRFGARVITAPRLRRSVRRAARPLGRLARAMRV